ncbi:hypothetical protein LINPERPRIM_LOCUS13591 [Linum perenne]
MPRRLYPIWPESCRVKQAFQDSPFLRLQAPSTGKTHQADCRDCFVIIRRRCHSSCRSWAHLYDFQRH